MGLPGSGKSTWAAANFIPTLSSDDIRALIADDPTIQSIHRRVFAVLRHLLRQRLELNRPVTAVDSTNLTRKERRAYIALANLYNAQVEAIFFDAPLDVCQARNRERTRKVPDDAIVDMAARLQPPSLDEGFTSIHRIA